MFCNLNDYELLYLYKENSERAEKLLFDKYQILINKIMAERNIKSNNDDIEQECLITLYNCMNRFDMNSSCSFFNYFLVCLKRQLFKSVSRNILECELVQYNDETYHQNELYFAEESPEYNKFIGKNELENKVYEEIIADNLSPRTFAKKYNVDIKKVYNTIYNIKRKIKKNYK